MLPGCLTPPLGSELYPGILIRRSFLIKSSVVESYSKEFALLSEMVAYTLLFLMAGRIEEL